MTSPTVQQIGHGEYELFVKKAEAEMLSRKRAGTWSGGLRAYTEYQGRLFDFIVEKLGVPANTLQWSANPGYENHAWDGDVDPIKTMIDAISGTAAQQGLDGQDTGVESATGTGKTFGAACLVLAFLGCFENSLVVTGAPKEEQLLLQIWMEIGRLFPRFQLLFPDAQLLPGSGKLRMRPPDKSGEGVEVETWAAVAFVAGVGATEQSANKARGFHREHMLIVTEETPGIHPAIMTAFEQTRTDDHNLHLALGNPDNRQDSLHLFCFDAMERPRQDVKHVRASALDHPNVVSGLRIVPGAIGRRRLKARTLALGEGTRLYEAMVRGISPTDAEDALIKWEWCIRAAKHYDDPEFRKGEEALGVDVANSEKGDRGAVARFKGACLTEVVAKACPDANVLGREVTLEAQEKGIPGRHVGVDTVGVGAGAFNEMRRLKFRARDLGGAQKAIPFVREKPAGVPAEDGEDDDLPRSVVKVVESERYDNLRSQMGWILREDLRNDEIAFPYDTELFRDLCALSYDHPNGKIRIAGKDEVRIKLKRSPNKGDATIYGNFVRPRRTRPKASTEEIPATTRQRDWRLERMVARNIERGKKEEQRIKRMFEARAREKKRAKRRPL